MIRKTIAYVVLSLLLLSMPRQSYALNEDVRSVLILSGCGVVGGAAAGLVTYPFTNDSKTVALGASMGLFLGLVAGIYYITHREDFEARKLRGTSSWLTGERLLQDGRLSLRARLWNSP